jgi:hypothetical protein
MNLQGEIRQNLLGSATLSSLGMRVGKVALIDGINIDILWDSYKISHTSILKTNQH